MADWSWIDAANLALAGYNAYQKSQGPQFKNPGMTPEQQQLYQLYFSSLTNPATANNASEVSNFAKAKLAAVNPTWTSPRTFSGDVGYSGHGPVNFNWQQTPGGGGSLPNIPAGPNFGGGSNASGPTGVAGDPFGHITSPAGSGGDPFGYMNNLPAGSMASGNTDASGLWDSLKSGMSSKGGMTSMLGLASMLGLPVGIVASWVARNQNNNNQPEKLPLTNKQYPIDILKPSNMPNVNQREQYGGNPTYQQQMGSQFMNNQNYNLGNNPGQIPSGVDPGFGYGWDTSAWVNGQGAPPRAPLF